jgi:hypothetical protein
MICPLCHQAMRQDRRVVSSNPKTSQRYNRSIYQCMGDDVWLTLEIPEDYKGNDGVISGPVL